MYHYSLSQKSPLPVALVLLRGEFYSSFLFEPPNKMESPYNCGESGGLKGLQLELTG
jgi:hypothetical protein